MKKSLLHFTLLGVFIAFCLPGHAISENGILLKDGTKLSERYKQENITKPVVKPTPTNLLTPTVRAVADDGIQADETTPFFENFEDQTGGLGGGLLGWQITHEGETDPDTGKGVNFFTISDYKSNGQNNAYSGTNVLASDWDDNAPLDRLAVTPSIQLYADVNYYISVWVYRKGYTNPGTGVSVADEFVIRYTTELLEAMSTNPELRGEVLIDGSGEYAERHEEWRQYSVYFTPEEDGAYYFGINVCTSVPGGNIIAFDDLSIAEVPASFPIADFVVSNISQESSKSVEFGGLIYVEDKSEDAIGTATWEFNAQDDSHKSGEYTTAIGGGMYYIFDGFDAKPGLYNITQTVENLFGPHSKTQTIKASAYGWRGEQYYVQYFDDPMDLYSTSGWTTITATEDDGSTFLSLVTYWDDPLRSKWFYLQAGNAYGVQARMFALYGKTKLTLKLARLDENNNIVEVGDLDTLEIEDSRYGYPEAVGFGVNVSGNYAFIYQPESTPDVSLFEGVVDENGDPVDPYVAVGMEVFLFALLDGELVNIENPEQNSSILVYAHDGNIILQDAEGETVRVYSIDGKQVYTGTNTTIPVQNGIYIVKVGGKTVKVIVK